MFYLSHRIMFGLRQFKTESALRNSQQNRHFSFGKFSWKFLKLKLVFTKIYHLFKLLNEILGRFDEFFHQPVGIRTLRWLDGDFDAVQRYSKLQDFFLISKENERFKF